MIKLTALYELQQNVAASSSTKKKIAELETFRDSFEYKQNCEFYNDIFNFIYDKDITFGITSDKVIHFIKPVQYRTFYGILNILDALSKRELTGDEALSSAQHFAEYLTISVGKEATKMFYDILDKDFKCGVNVKTMSKVFPIKLPFTEYVALANKYFEREDKVDFDNEEWLWSRKLDGNRLILIKGKYETKCFSRQGKEIKTLGVLKEVIDKVPGEFVLDGEICIIDENGDENFQEIMKVINKKNYTIEHPVMKVFDILTEDEFYGHATSPILYDRYEKLKWMLIEYGDILDKNFSLVEQNRVTNKEHLMVEFAKAQQKGWEGLMIRRNIPYECGRTNNLLKVKGFYDDEYKVVGYEMGDMRFVEEGHQVEKEVLASITINHKGFDVKVGSGFSKEQREYLHEHPEEIIGSTVKVQYFEETNNMQGGISLRFPTVVYFYGKNERFD